MNGFSPPRNPYAQGYPATSTGGRPMADPSRRDQNTNPGKNAPRDTSKTADRTQSSLVDLNDPIQVHLLTESALFDSRRFEILSQEEVDDLKKQCQSLGQRIEKTRSNLAIQTKYRDAAISMAKLYTPAPSSVVRRTPVGGRGANRESAEAELERQTTERRCNELAAELSALEARLMGPQRRLLEHTAAILQLTHKASKKKQLQPPSALPLNGMPGSPESLYTYSNGRSSVDAGDDAFLDFQDPVGRMRALDSVEVPPKSPPVRGQTVKLQEERDQLRRENDRLRQETSELRAQSDAFGLEIDAFRREGSDHERDVADMERRLGSLNSALRDVIVMFNPTKNSNYRMPPATANGSSGAGGLRALGNQLEYLTSSITTIRREQEEEPPGSRSLGTGAEPAAEVVTQAQERIDALTKQMTDLLLSVNATPPPPPNPAQMGSTDLALDDRISHLQHSLRVVETELMQAVQASVNAFPMPVSSGDAEPKLKELWDIVQNGLLELQRQRQDRQRVRAEKGLADEEDMTIDQTFDLEEKYTAIELQSRVKTIASQLSKLTEQKCVLKRQIKQQRELNNKSSGEKDIELENKDAEIEKRIAETHNKEVELQGKIAQLDAREAEVAELTARLAESNSSGGSSEEDQARIKELEAELAETKQYLEQSREDGSQTQGMLVSALRDLDTANRDADTRESENLKSARTELEEKREKLAALESRSKDLESRLNMTEASRAELQTRMDGIDGKIETLEGELAEARAALAAAEGSSETRQRELEGKQREVKEKDDVLESLNLMIAELKTELTITQAELEGAYGSRAERAADLAAIKSSDEVAELKAQMETYKNELEQTLKQLEEVTRETLGAEREKLDMETRLGDVVASKGVLEEEVRELRERVESEGAKARERVEKLQEELDGVRLKGGEGKSGAGAAMLSEQFRATMRVERKKFQEDLREEQGRRRKLEEELAKLKRAQGPGKSPLSPR